MARGLGTVAADSAPAGGFGFAPEEITERTHFFGQP